MTLLTDSAECNPRRACSRMHRLTLMLLASSLLLLVFAPTAEAQTQASDDAAASDQQQQQQLDKVDRAEALLDSILAEDVAELVEEESVGKIASGGDVVGATGELTDLYQGGGGDVVEEAITEEITLMSRLRVALEAERASAAKQRERSEKEIEMLRAVIVASESGEEFDAAKLLSQVSSLATEDVSTSSRTEDDGTTDDLTGPVDDGGDRRRDEASQWENQIGEEGDEEYNDEYEEDPYFYLRNGLLASLCIGFVALVAGSKTAAANVAPIHVSEDPQRWADAALARPPAANRASLLSSSSSVRRRLDDSPPFLNHADFLPMSYASSASTMRSRRRARDDQETATGTTHDHDWGAPYGTVAGARRGPAPLGSHAHPLHREASSPRRHRHQDRWHSRHDRQDQSLKPNLKSLMAVVREQGQIVADALIHGKTTKRRRQRRSSYWSGQQESAGAFKNLLLVVPALFVSYHLGPVALDHATKPKPWSWSPEPRRLANRNCVMNFFIEKQPPDEYNPDFVEIKPGELNKDGTPKEHEPVKPVPGTHRTKGELHVISRYIEAVADSFRSKTKLRQHVIFAGARDGGDLAARAMRHWPPRGRHRTQVHVIADDQPTDADEAALGYGSLGAIEERFKEDENAHVYDRRGRAGIEGDDDETDSVDEMEGVGDLTREGEEGVLTVPYPSLASLVYGSDELESSDEIVVPYLHVDGTSAADQFEILNSARSLLESSTISAVAIEHSPDLELKDLIDFFREVNYKTFFLGSRQIARVDHLCEEVLEDVSKHPSVIAPEPSFLREMLQRLGVVKVENAHLLTEDGKRRETPPFFVAMPRGRRSKEEMTIQHMYDLFGGYGGGAGQVKTANDRKAPGK